MFHSGPLQLNAVYWSIQGEGVHTGRSALFVKMPFCNLKCAWCDTDFSTWTDWTEQLLAQVAMQQVSRFAVLSGGEPTRHKHIWRVVSLLKGLGFTIAVESNGTCESEVIYALFDWVTISPKKDSERLGLPQYYASKAALKMAHEFKYVMEKNFDVRVLNRHEIADGRRYFVVPEAEDFLNTKTLVLAWVAENPAWRISLQTHHLMGAR